MQGKDDDAELPLGYTGLNNQQESSTHDERYLIDDDTIRY